MLDGDDVTVPTVPIFPSDAEEIDALRNNMEARRAREPKVWILHVRVCGFNVLCDLLDVPNRGPDVALSNGCLCFSTTERKEAQDCGGWDVRELSSSSIVIIIIVIIIRCQRARTY
jgi:hypothetical protein